MTLATSTRYKLYQPLVTTTDFDVPFPLFDPDDVEVYVDGSVTTLFSINGTWSNGVSNDATVILNTGVTDVDVEIYGDRDPRRESDYLGNSPNLADNLQKDADSLTAVQQEQKRNYQSTLRVSAQAPIVSPLSGDAAARANKALMFSADGNGLELGPEADAIENAQRNADSAQAALDEILAIAGVHKAAATIAAMTSDDGLAVGEFVTVKSGYNGEPETFKIVPASTYNANSQEVVDLTGISGQAVTTRMKFNTGAEFDADTRADSYFTNGEYMGVGGPSGFTLKKVDTGEHLTTTGGSAKWKVLPGVLGYDPIAFKAAGDGVTDDNEALQAAATAAEGGSLHISAPFKTGKQISFPNNVHINCAVGAYIDIGAIDASGDAPDSAGLFFGSSDALAALPALSSDIAAGEVAVPFASAHGLAVNDYFIIYNPTDSSFNAARSYYRDGEICRVAEVTSSTAVVVAEPLYASHASATVTCHKSQAYRYSFSGALRVLGDPSLAAIKAIRFENVVASDISRIDVSGDQLSSALSLKRCKDITGTGVKAHQRGSSGAGTDYGVVFSNSQDCHLEGSFSAERHGSTMGGGNDTGDIPCRGNSAKGTFATHGAGSTTLAADFHGNVEHCKYEGLFRGGINAGGDKNRYRGRVIANEGGVVVYGSELLGLSHDFSGCEFVSRDDVTSTSRGCFDIGGNSEEIGTFTTRGGILDLSNTKWDVPQVQDHIVMIRNRGATFGTHAEISLRGAKVEASYGTGVNFVRINNVSGDVFDRLDLDGISADQALDWSISHVTDINLWKQTGEVTVAVTTSDSVGRVSVLFDWAYPVAPNVQVTSNDHVTSGDRVGAFASSIAAAGFDFDFRRMDQTGAFGGADILEGQWLAS